MFDNLVESSPHRGKIGGTASSSLMSLVIHGLLIYVAVMATMKVHEVIAQTPGDTNIVFLTRPQEKPPEPEKQAPLSSLTPPPKGFQNIKIVTEIPTSIPPVNLNERFDPRDYTGKGVEGGIDKGVVGGTGPVPTDLAQVYISSVVDEIPIRLSGPTPQYPSILQQAGMEGHVVTQVVIGMDGRPEPETFRIISSNNAAFERPAREAVLRSVYRPGRMRGEAVRVLVEIPVNFQINKAR